MNMFSTLNQAELLYEFNAEPSINNVCSSDSELLRTHKKYTTFKNNELCFEFILAVMLLSLDISKPFLSDCYEEAKLSKMQHTSMMILFVKNGKKRFI